MLFQGLAASAVPLGLAPHAERGLTQGHTLSQLDGAFGFPAPGLLAGLADWPPGLDFSPSPLLLPPLPSSGVAPREHSLINILTVYPAQACFLGSPACSTARSAFTAPVQAPQAGRWPWAGWEAEGDGQGWKVGQGPILTSPATLPRTLLKAGASRKPLWNFQQKQDQICHLEIPPWLQ